MVFPLTILGACRAGVDAQQSALLNTDGKDRATHSDDTNGPDLLVSSMGLRTPRP
jgi:hypothetical protein